jgi:acylphosphatase
MKIRAILTIKGDVQEAGYRVIIQKTALKMGFTGYTENLKNGNVKVVCECEKNKLDKFIEAITVRNDFVSVEKIEKKVEKATGEYESFEVKVGEMAFEMFQGYATAGKYFNWLGQKVDASIEATKEVGQNVKKNIEATKEVGEKVEGVGQKVDIVGEKVEGVGQKVDIVGEKVEGVGQKVDIVGEKVEGVGQKVDNLTVHTDEHFNKLDEKYGIVSETLISMNKKYDVLSETLVSMNNEQTRTREELTRAVDTLNTLVSSVNILIKEHIENER